MEKGIKNRKKRMKKNLNEHKVYVAEKYNNNGASFNLSFTGSTSKPSDCKTTTPSNTLSIKSEIQTGKASSLPLTFIQALPLSTFTAPAPVNTCSSETGLIPSSSASFLGKVVKLAPVSTNALTIFECFLSKSDISISTDVCPMIKDNRGKYINVSNFKLQKIKDIYDNLDNLNGKKLVFLDEQGNEVKVKSIKKEPYSGRIYDLTVPNHIILVRRDGLIVWSLNSCNKFTSLVYGSHTFKVYFKIKEEKMKVKTDSAKSETGDYPIVWLFIQVLHPAFTSFKRNETI